MPAIHCSNLAYAWPDGTTLFENLDIALEPGRIGLVGRNGSGKSTLLRLIAGELFPVSGHVRTGGSIAYLPQNPVVVADTVLADLLGVARARHALDAVAAGSVDPTDLALAAEAWDLEERARACLRDLPGLVRLADDDDFLDRPATKLSGGEAMLAALAGVTLSRPDIALLDEPSNNLDHDARQWLYHAVDRWQGLLLVVSHDRELLERMDDMVELRHGGLRRYGGGFSFYEECREAERIAAQAHMTAARSSLDRERRQRAKGQARTANASRQGKKSAAQSQFPTGAIHQRRGNAEVTAGRQRAERDKRIARAEEQWRTAKEHARADDTIRLEWPGTEVPAGKTVLELVHGGGRVTVAGPERIALSGPNGAGKSTLLRVLTGRQIHPAFQVGRIVDGVGLVPQRIVFPDENAELLEVLARLAPGLSRHDAHARLAQLLFRGEQTRRTAGSLSGGERLRLALAGALSRTPAPQLLLLDEPTNNLDLASVAELAATLERYRGALVVVSHDRYFLEAVRTTRTWRMDAMRLNDG